MFSECCYLVWHLTKQSWDIRRFCPEGWAPKRGKAPSHGTQVPRLLRLIFALHLSFYIRYHSSFFFVVVFFSCSQEVFTAFYQAARYLITSNVYSNVTFPEADSVIYQERDLDGGPWQAQTRRKYFPPSGLHATLNLSPRRDLPCSGLIFATKFVILNTDAWRGASSCVWNFGTNFVWTIFWWPWSKHPPEALSQEVNFVLRRVWFGYEPIV